MKRYTLLFALAALVILSCPNDDENPPPYELLTAVPLNNAIPADIMGMVHAGYHFGNEAEYALLDEMGIVWMLRDFSWSDIQPEKDNWRVNFFDKYVADAEANNKKIVGLLAYSVGWLHNETCGHQLHSRVIAGEDEVEAFCEYVRRTVTYYKGKVGAWSIWNEPNLTSRFWVGTPEEFFTLTIAAAAAIREVDPDAVILGGGLNTTANNDIWTKGLFDSGAMEQIDYFSYHPYMPNALTTGRAYSAFRDYIEPYGFADKIWVTEVGYPLDMGPGGYDTKVREEDMPDTTAKTLAILAAEGARFILWYELFDHGAAGEPDDSEDWFGLVDRDTLTKKGGGEAYQICAHNIPGKTLRYSWLERITAYYFEGSNGEHSLIIWNDYPGTRPQDIQVTLPGTGQKVWNVAAGTSEPLGETSAWKLKTRDADGNKPLQFFTWKNTDLTPPQIAAR
jgi:hypothetical protein